MILVSFNTRVHVSTLCWFRVEGLLVVALSSLLSVLWGFREEDIPAGSCGAQKASVATPKLVEVP